MGSEERFERVSAQCRPLGLFDICRHHRARTGMNSEARNPAAGDVTRAVGFRWYMEALQWELPCDITVLDRMLGPVCLGFYEFTRF